MNRLDELIGQRMPDRAETCKTHGPYTSTNYFGHVWSKCPKCAEDEREAERQAAELKAREEKKAAWERKIGASGIPERFQTRSLQSFVAESEPQRKALAIAEHYADNFDDALKTGRSMLFIGRPGTGKTHLAAGIALRIMRRDNRTALFLTVMRAIRRIKDTWAKGSAESETQAIAALVFPDLLILDEVGVQFGSEAEKLLLFDVLNERYEKRKPTILISNLSQEDVTEYLGDRIIDRFREGGGKLVPFTWDSYRSKA